MTTRFQNIIGGVVLFALGGIAVSGQAQRGPATLDDVLGELRGLRADLAQTSAAGVRAQLLTARLAMQEGRISLLGQQMAQGAAHLEAMTRERQGADDRLKQVDTALAGGLLPDTRTSLEAERKVRQVEAARAQERESAARAEMDALTNGIVTEQTQWTAFSNRIEDLERSLQSR